MSVIVRLFCFVTFSVHFNFMTESRTGEEIFDLVQRVKKDYVLADRLDAITTDNGANFVNAVRLMIEHGVAEEDIRCACHTLQLSIKKSLEVTVCIKYLIFIHFYIFFSLQENHIV